MGISKIEIDSLEEKLEELEDKDLTASILAMLQHLYDNLGVWIDDHVKLHYELNRTIKIIRNI